MHAELVHCFDGRQLPGNGVHPSYPAPPTITQFEKKNYTKSGGNFMAALTYVKGDATQPQGDGAKYIVHCCNDLGLWGAGFVLALSKRWRAPQACYQDWAEGKSDIYPPFMLGQVQLVQVMRDITVVNMIGQHGVSTASHPDYVPVRYDAIGCALLNTWAALWRDAEQGRPGPFSVHCPRFGAGLAGGDWSQIEPLLIKELVDKNIPVTVYDFE
jgi:O-acetyl-ADP-ribose deacetylase (regulator of RNase III)